MKREIGEITAYHSQGQKLRNTVKVLHGQEMNAVYVAKQHPEICGEWYVGCQVHHIDGNPLNDDPNNLIVVSVETHRRLHAKPVRAFYKTQYVGLFESMKSCAEALEISPSAVSYYCKHHKPICSTYKDYRFILV